MATGLGVVFVLEDVLRAPRRDARRACGSRSRASATSAPWWRASSPPAARRSSAVSDVTGGIVDPDGPRPRRGRAPGSRSTASCAATPGAEHVGRHGRARDAVRRAGAGGARAPDHAPRTPSGWTAGWWSRRPTGPTTPEADEILADAGHPGDPRRARQRRRRHGELLRVGAGPAEVLVERRGDRGAAAAPAPGGVRAGRGRARTQHDVDWRTAAQSVAIERVAEASRLRTIYP